MNKLNDVVKITGRVLMDILDVFLGDEQETEKRKDRSDYNADRVRPVDDVDFEYDLVTTGQRIDLVMSNGDLDPKL